MRKQIPLKSIYAFVAVAETGSMTEAAQVLHVSHSAISQAIKSLETQLNRTLFERVGRQVALNASGRKYYKQVAPALEQIVIATEQLAAENNLGRLTLNMVNSLALHWWIPRLGDFQLHAPQLDVRLSNLPGVFSLEQQGIDVALVHGTPDEWQEYYCEKLADDELILVCSPELAARSSSVDLAEILRQSRIITVSNERRKNDWEIWCQAQQITLPATDRHLQFLVSAQAVQATIRRLGVLVTHKLFVKDDIEAGLLTQIGETVCNPYQAFYWVCSPNKLKQESTMVLRSWVKHAFSR
ncbi:LysR substrate-binding domain-containing protein [Vibrio sp. IRLE0018]|uniref:LysR substrate-binding domain-containing protein n=1 Tax=Vibrio floridensis TaxID=2908007 RepID=UPI001A2C4FDE|nr:LysR substrate-binding domain-containing protein [Vibrio floridensis]MCF8777349.1 LysR substrate-binding domain-containing protein [Vibrio floridensis]HAS6346510.1 LysR family transcriptional regulator [Vibrio vulnificus]